MAKATQISADELRRGLRRLLVYVFALAAAGLALFVGLFRQGAVDALRLAEAAVAATVMVALTYFLVPCLLDGGCARLAFATTTATLLGALGVMLYGVV